MKSVLVYIVIAHAPSASRFSVQQGTKQGSLTQRKSLKNRTRPGGCRLFHALDQPNMRVLYVHDAARELRRGIDIANKTTATIKANSTLYLDSRSRGKFVPG
jgi:hypothetical protein